MGAPRKRASRPPADVPLAVSPGAVPSDAANGQALGAVVFIRQHRHAGKVYAVGDTEHVDPAVRERLRRFRAIEG